MPTKNRFAELQNEITEWRRDLHENPEILFETHRTSAIVADKLKEFGCDEIVTGIGRTGAPTGGWQEVASNSIPMMRSIRMMRQPHSHWTLLKSPLVVHHAAIDERPVHS